MKRALGFAVALLLGSVPDAGAQLSTGNVYGTVADESGAVLPGATIRVSGPTIGGHSTTAGSNGDFRFLNLDPGAYRLTVAHPGFTTVERAVIVTTGHNLELAFRLNVATVEETISITIESPIIDTKKLGTLTTLSREELGQVPSSRDPWAILRTIPGVVVDRVDIAGNESGQQSGFQAKGADSKDTIWSLDGLAITDMAATGTSPVYFDFGAFDEISVSTGGNDFRAATGGIGINFVTRRGTNAFHGGAQGYFTHRALQTSNIAGTPLATDPRLIIGEDAGGNPIYSDKADHIDQIASYGVDVGGPLLADRLWFWGSYGRQDIRNVRINQTKDRTVLQNVNAKVNWQAGSADMVSLFYFRGAKEKYGRKPGYVGDEPASFTWNQGNQFEDNPLHGLFKVEDNHVFGPKLFLNMKYAYFNTGFGLEPVGGPEQPGGVDFWTATAVGSYTTYSAIRPQHTASLDGNYFFAGLGGSHELRFGFGYRRTTVHSTTSYSGPDKTFALKYTPSSGYAYVTRDRVSNFGTDYVSGYLGDTFTKGRLTVSAGARWDHQTGGNDPSSAPANPAFPDLLPTLAYEEAGQGATWSDLSPRLGITYALGESRKAVVRASYARYAGQLSAGDASYDSPAGLYSPYLAYNWIDRNGDGIAQRDEILVEEGIQYFGFVDPAHPASVVSPNQIAASYEANIDHEVIVGIDHELVPNLALSAAYTFRRSGGLGWYPRIGLGASDYAANPPRTFNGYTAQSFSPDPALVDATGGGRILSNRPGYGRQYNGFELSLTKRLSNKWMARVAGSYMDWTERFAGGDALGSGAVQNATRTSYTWWGDSGPQVEDGQVPQWGKGGAVVAPRWQVIANGLYQLPWGFEFAGSLFARQGFARPIVLRLSAGRDGTLPVLGVGADTTGQTSSASTGKVDDVRYETLTNLDLRLAYNRKLSGNTTLAVTADCFNVLNSGSVLNQNGQANAESFNRLDELLSPRVFRFGLRVAF